ARAARDVLGRPGARRRRRPGLLVVPVGDAPRLGALRAVV
ncbi:MAG: Beta-lactamase class C-like and penicillin binding proteins (PBPs) superfamily, partial [uncultured Nocardioidaceae bacterium]